MILANQTILFQGDSITDAGRLPQHTAANESYGLGTGYAGIIASSLLSERPADNLKFFNRGVSGNRVTVLLGRWHIDTIPLKPDVLSILIGINDKGLSRALYEKAYHLLLETTREELPATRLVLCEPFALAAGPLEQKWVDEIRRRSPIVRNLAAKFDAIFVPFQKLFDDLTQEGPAEYWLPDGVHPSPGGHARMAQFWKQAVEG